MLRPPRARSRVRDGRGCLFGALSPHENRLATARRFDETRGRIHLQNRSAGGLDLADDPLAMDEFLTRVRRCGRGLTGGRKKRAHLPSVALSSLSWEATTNGQGAWRQASVHLRTAIEPEIKRSFAMSVQEGSGLEFRRSFTPPRYPRLRRNPLPLQHPDPRRRVRSSHIRSPRRRVRLWRWRSNQCRRTRWLE